MKLFRSFVRILGSGYLFFIPSIPSRAAIKITECLRKTALSFFVETVIFMEGEAHP